MYKIYTYHIGCAATLQVEYIRGINKPCFPEIIIKEQKFNDMYDLTNYDNFILELRIVRNAVKEIEDNPNMTLDDLTNYFSIELKKIDYNT